MEVSGTGERRVLKSFRREQTAGNGLGCDVRGFYCFLGVLRGNQRRVLEFGLELWYILALLYHLGVEIKGRFWQTTHEVIL